MTKLSFHITEEEYAALEELSERESRLPNGLAGEFVRQGLRREGVLRDGPATIPEYMVVEGNYYLGIMEEVNRLISEGWRPLGGIAVYGLSRQFLHGGDEQVYGYVQAMVKQ